MNNKILKTLIIIAFSYLVKDCTPRDPAGAKLTIKQEIITKIQKQFLPPILKQFGEIHVDPQTIVVREKLPSIKLELSNILINLGDIDPQSLDITLEPPNKARVIASNITGSGQFHSDALISDLLPLHDDIKITISRLDAIAEFVMDTVESKTEKGKLMPSVYLDSISIPNFEFDFEIHGSAFGVLATMVKELIKSYIKNSVITNLINNIKETSKKAISEVIEKLPVYADIKVEGFEDFAVDTSLTSPFRIINDYIVAAGNGALINKKIPETNPSPFQMPDYIPDYDAQGKDMQVYLSEYFLNTALNTLFLSKRLHYVIVPEELVPSPPMPIDSTLIDVLFNGVAALHGKGKKIKLGVEATQAPVVSFDNNIGIDAHLKFTILVEHESEYQEAVNFTTHLKASAKVNLEEQGKINVEVLSVSATESIATEAAYNSGVMNLQSIINLGSKMALQQINDELKKKLKPIELPLILEMIDISNSKADLKRGYIEVTVTPELKPKPADELIYLEKTNANSNEADLNELVLIWF
jgi:hypothetical protein